MLEPSILYTRGKLNTKELKTKYFDMFELDFLCPIHWNLSKGKTTILKDPEW
jgi:hypothetical protein